MKTKHCFSGIFIPNPSLSPKTEVQVSIHGALAHLAPEKRRALTMELISPLSQNSLPCQAQSWVEKGSHSSLYLRPAQRLACTECK